MRKLLFIYFKEKSFKSLKNILFYVYKISDENYISDVNNEWNNTVVWSIIVLKFV